MNNNLSVRSLLVDKTTGKLIKAVDERDLSDFLPLITEGVGIRANIVIFDFAPVIQYFHAELGNKLASRENKDLAIKRATVFNTWMRLKAVTNEMLLCQTSAQVMRDSEEALNWIHTRIPELKDNYYRADGNNNQYPFSNKKTEALLRLSDEIEVFIEILLCNIHATAKADIKSFKSDVVIRAHCKSIQELVIAALKSEANYCNGNFNQRSIIYPVCMEDLGVNAEALLCLLDSPETVESIKKSILSRALIEDYFDGYENLRKYSIDWPRSDHNNLERVKLLSQLLERINLLLVLIENLRDSDVSFENDSEGQSDFENSIQKLLPQRRT